MPINDIYQSLNPVAFSIGSLVVRWYGLGYVFGIVLGALIMRWVAKRWQLKFESDQIMIVMIAATFGIVLGGRLGYVIFYNFGEYLANPAKILAFNEGGMSFHGGVIGMVIAMVICTRFIRIPFLTLGDMVCVAAPLGIMLVRIANFINGELWGAETSGWWGVDFASGGGVFRHPTQLYEAFFEGLVLLLVQLVLVRRKPDLPRGAHIGVFMTLYAVFRIAIEFVRQPDVQLGYLFGGWLTMGMVLSFLQLLFGVGLLVYAARSRKPHIERSSV